MSERDDDIQPIKRWATDANGRTAYYPYGPAFSGYLVGDAAREQALRAADERLHKQMRAYGRLLILPFISAAYYFEYRNPVMVFTSLAAGLVFAMLVGWLLRRTMIGSLLTGLVRVDGTERFPWQRPVIAIIVLVGAIWFALCLYDLRIAAISAHPSTINFYPDVSGFVIGMVLFDALALGMFAKRDSLSTKSGTKKTAIAIVTIAVCGLLATGETAWTFYRPRPALVISRNYLSCKWHVHIRWTEISGLSLHSSGRREYVRAELELTRSQSDSEGHSTKSCEVTGLNADYDVVYKEIEKAWRAASQESSPRT